MNSDLVPACARPSAELAGITRHSSDRPELAYVSCRCGAATAGAGHGVEVFFEVFAVFEPHPALIGLGFDRPVREHAGRAAANEFLLDDIELLVPALLGLGDIDLGFLIIMRIGLLVSCCGGFWLRFIERIDGFGRARRLSGDGLIRPRATFARARTRDAGICGSD